MDMCLSFSRLVRGCLGLWALAAATIAGGGVVTMRAAERPADPTPHGAVPSPRQLAWHELEFYGFVHFTVNTFTDREWG